MSRIVSQPIDTAFNPDIVQIFPGNGTQTMKPETTSQKLETAHNDPQTGSPLLKSIADLKPLLAKR